MCIFSNVGLGDAAKMDAATLDITSNSLVAKIPVLFLGVQRALIIQASSLSSSSTSGTIVFPAAFPNACIVALTHDYSSAGTDLSNVKFNVPSQTSVNWYAQNMGTGSTSTPPSSWGWLAIGW
ncbi:gp53-like domain-containing protein [Citrobacter amalonaticus]